MGGILPKRRTYLPESLGLTTGPRCPPSHPSLSPVLCHCWPACLALRLPTYPRLFALLVIVRPARDCSPCLSCQVCDACYGGARRDNHSRHVRRRQHDGHVRLRQRSAPPRRPGRLSGRHPDEGARGTAAPSPFSPLASRSWARGEGGSRGGRGDCRAFANGCFANGWVSASPRITGASVDCCCLCPQPHALCLHPPSSRTRPPSRDAAYRDGRRGGGCRARTLGGGGPLPSGDLVLRATVLCRWGERVRALRHIG